MTFNIRLIGLASAAALTLMAAPAAMARSDASFMKQAAQDGAAEVEASKLAQTKAQRADVKAFAETMVAEHKGTAPSQK